MIQLYLPGTDENQFINWLNTYCRQQIASDLVYEFAKGWNYRLYYPSQVPPTAALDGAVEAKLMV